MGSTGEPPSKKKKLPKYAVINLEESSDVGELFQVLITRGYSNVTFLHSLKEHPDVKSFLEGVSNGIKCATTTQEEKSQAAQEDNHQINHEDKTCTSSAESTVSDTSTTTLSFTAAKEDLGPILGSAEAPINLDDIITSSIDRVIAQNVKTPRFKNCQGFSPAQTAKSFRSRMEQKLSADGIPIPIPSTSGPLTAKEEENKLQYLIEQQSPSNRQPSPDIQITNVIRVNEPLPLVNSGGQPAVRIRSNQHTSNDDTTKYVICCLCDNKIMSSRLSNLTNHVRRHAATKQFQCGHCNYQHNEQAKVRLHMSHNHQDTVSSPIDNLTPDMQKMWNQLMDQCFPGYMDQLKATEMDAIMRQHGQKTRPANGYSPVPSNTIHNCIECGDAISVPDYAGCIPQLNPYETHLANCHKNECIAHKCGQCGYSNAEEWKVRWHISTCHAHMAAEVKVCELPRGCRLDLFIMKYFPSAVGARVDPQEEELMKQLNGADAPQRTAAKIQAAVDKGDRSFRGEKSGSPELDMSIYTPITSVDEAVYGTMGKDCILCVLCGKILDFANKTSLCSLMAHAKRHYHIKQFECTLCRYTSSEAAHVRGHLLTKHNSQEKPIDNNNEVMQSAWIQIMKKCFPELEDKIANFKFKSGKSDVGYALEEDSRSPSLTPSVTHSYGTRTSTNARNQIRLETP